MRPVSKLTEVYIYTRTRTHSYRCHFFFTFSLAPNKAVEIFPIKHINIENHEIFLCDVENKTPHKCYTFQFFHTYICPWMVQNETQMKIGNFTKNSIEIVNCE